MCGSGTILTEAYQIAKNIAPGLHRERFSFMNWDNYDADLWENLVKEAKDQQKATKAHETMEEHRAHTQHIHIHAQHTKPTQQTNKPKTRARYSQAHTHAHAVCTSTRTSMFMRRPAHKHTHVHVHVHIRT